MSWAEHETRNMNMDSKFYAFGFKYFGPEFENSVHTGLFALNIVPRPLTLRQIYIMKWKNVTRSSRTQWWWMVGLRAQTHKSIKTNLYSRIKYNKNIGLFLLTFNFLHQVRFIDVDCGALLSEVFHCEPSNFLKRFTKWIGFKLCCIYFFQRMH